MRIRKPTALVVVVLAVLVALGAKWWQLTMTGGPWFLVQQAVASSLYVVALAAAAVVVADRLVALGLLAVLPPSRGALVVGVGVALMVILGLTVAASVTSANTDAPGWARGLSFTFTALSDVLSIMEAFLLGAIGALKHCDKSHPSSEAPAS